MFQVKKRGLTMPEENKERRADLRAIEYVWCQSKEAHLQSIVTMWKGSLSEIRGIFIWWMTQQFISKPYSVRLKETYWFMTQWNSVVNHLVTLNHSLPKHAWWSISDTMDHVYIGLPSIPTGTSKGILALVGECNIPLNGGKDPGVWSAYL